MEQKETTKIEWLDWTDEAFRRAEAEQKPVLLDISAVWCHWCHGLDADTYSVPEIAKYIDSHFIPIRVDTDKRPDINRRYNMGGWPTTAFLTPKGNLIGGGTYFPPDKMNQVLHDVYSYWEKSKNQNQEIALPQPEPKLSGPLSKGIIDEVLGEVANSFDPIYGGFGSQPKFPNTEAHELALIRYHNTGNREFLRIVTATLQSAGKGGVYDNEAGGFFRYSTLRDWSVPHYEKMCEDNAKWLTLYTHVYQITRDQFYLEKMRGILNYVNTWLSDNQNGCFYGSQDADEEYYALNMAERSKRKAPYVDKNIYTNWNALMIRAYLECSAATGDNSILQFAFKSLERLMKISYESSSGMLHYYDNQPHVPNQLEDQMQTCMTLCEAHEITGKIQYLNKAEEIVETAIRNLYDHENGGFFDTRVDPYASGFLSKATKPLDENSHAASVLTKLYHLTQKGHYRKLAEASLRNFVDVYPQLGFMAADFAVAVDALLTEPVFIRIVGSREDKATVNLLNEARNVFEPRKIVQLLDPVSDADRIKTFGLGNALNPTVYVCAGTFCTAPVTEHAQLSVRITDANASRARR
jgi:uncharacterized protein YyaL (SSP411 family)